MADDSSETVGERQGQEQANRLGGSGDDGQATGAGMTGAGSATGDASDMRSEGGGDAGGSGLGGVDAGTPGGMGGAGVSGATGTDRPPGGMSPLLGDPHNKPTEDES